MSNATLRAVTPAIGRAAHSAIRHLAPHRFDHLAIGASDIQGVRIEDVKLRFFIDLGTLGHAKLP